MAPKRQAAAGSKRKKQAVNDQEQEGEQQTSAESKEPPSKQAKHDESTDDAGDRGASPKLEKLLDKYGSFPLEDFGLDDPTSPTAPTLLAHLFNAMLTAARISHELATRSVKCMIEAGYHNLDTLRKSTWDERCAVLTKGGYTRYREKTATGLEELAELLSDKYDGDLNNLAKAANHDPKKIRELVKEVKGIGDVAVNIFCDTAQTLWTSLAPAVDPRSLKTSAEMGLSDNIPELYEHLGEKPEKMARLCVALTTVRLEKKQGEFK